MDDFYHSIFLQNVPCFVERTLESLRVFSFHCLITVSYSLKWMLLCKISTDKFLLEKKYTKTF